MIAELSSKQKWLIIIVGVIVSLITHLAILDIRFHTQSWIKTLITPSSPHSLQPIMAQRPITMTTHVPHPPRMVRAPAPVLSQPITPAQIAQPAQEPPASTHRVYRAGTGFDAPQTDKPLATAGGSKTTTPPHKTAPHKTEKPPAPQLQAQTQPLSSPTHSARTLSDTPSYNPNRLPIVIHEQNEHVHLPAQSRAPELPTPAPTKQDSGAFSFLAQNNFNQLIQSDTTSETPADSNSSTNTMGGFGSRYGVREQYGDSRFLHYNSRIYQALQQSMDIEISRISQQYYHMLLEGAHTPTRIRFALDQDGTVKQTTITLSSGSPRYDTLAQRIVQEASYPPIPASFNMHTTYHQYGIILYNDGALNEHVGVSPYLEGE